MTSIDFMFSAKGALDYMEELRICTLQVLLDHARCCPNCIQHRIRRFKAIAAASVKTACHILLPKVCSFSQMKIGNSPLLCYAEFLSFLFLLNVGHPGICACKQHDNGYSRACVAVHEPVVEDDDPSPKAGRA